MTNAVCAVSLFSKENPDTLDKAMIRSDCIYLWTKEDPIQAVKKWKSHFGKTYKVRAAFSSEVATRLNEMYNSAITPLPLDVGRMAKI